MILSLGPSLRTDEFCRTILRPGLQLSGPTRSRIPYDSCSLPPRSQRHFPHISVSSLGLCVSGHSLPYFYTGTQVLGFCTVPNSVSFQKWKHSHEGASSRSVLRHPTSPLTSTPSFCRSHLSGKFFEPTLSFLSLTSPIFSTVVPGPSEVRRPCRFSLYVSLRKTSTGPDSVHVKKEILSPLSPSY